MKALIFAGLLLTMGVQEASAGGMVFSSPVIVFPVSPGFFYYNQDRRGDVREYERHKGWHDRDREWHQGGSAWRYR